MTKQLPVKELDVVEVLPGCPFQGLVYSKGIVRESLSFMSCMVEFPADKRSTDGTLISSGKDKEPWKEKSKDKKRKKDFSNERNRKRNWE